MERIWRLRGIRHRARDPGEQDHSICFQEAYSLAGETETDGQKSMLGQPPAELGRTQEYMASATGGLTEGMTRVGRQEAVWLSGKEPHLAPPSVVSALVATPGSSLEMQDLGPMA